MYSCVFRKRIVQYVCVCVAGWKDYFAQCIQEKKEKTLSVFITHKLVSGPPLQIHLRTPECVCVCMCVCVCEQLGKEGLKVISH